MNYTWIRRELQAGSGYDKIMQMFKVELVSEALAATGGNKSQAARVLKISRNNIARWTRQLSGK